MAVRLLLEAGSDTEELVRFIAQNLDDATLDTVEIARKPEESNGLANEVLTSAVVLSLGVATISAVTRIIERWLESKRQAAQLRIVAEGFLASDKAGAALTSLARQNAGVSLAYGTVDAAWATQKGPAGGAA